VARTPHRASTGRLPVARQFSLQASTDGNVDFPALKQILRHAWHALLSPHRIHRYNCEHRRCDPKIFPTLGSKLTKPKGVAARRFTPSPQA